MFIDVGILASIGLYLIGWCSQFSLFQKHLSLSPLVEIRTLQGACLLHSVVLIVILFTHSWPERLIPDIINTIAWLPVFIYLLFRKWINSEISATSIPLFTVFLLLISWGFLKQNLPTLASIQQARLFHQTLLISHITTLIAGYILFGISCISSILFLYQEHQIKTKLVKVLIHRFPSLTTLDQISNRSVTMGFLFFTLGLILGILLSDGLQSVRNIWRLGIVLLVWLFYALFLLERLFSGHQQRFSAIWSIIASILLLLSVIVEMTHLI